MMTYFFSPMQMSCFYRKCSCSSNYTMGTYLPLVQVNVVTTPYFKHCTNLFWDSFFSDPNITLLHLRWGEPIRFGFKWTVFGFFWLKNEDPNELEKIPLLGSFFNKGPKERLLQLWVASTIGMLRDVYVGNGMLLRRNVWDNKILKNKTDSYRNKSK